MTRVWQNTGWLVGARLLNGLLSLGYLALATRSLGIERFGQLSLIVALGQAITQLATFQSWQLVVRWGGQENGGDAVGFAIALDMLGVTAGIGLALVLLYPLGGWLPLPASLTGPAFAFCAISVLSMRTTPIGILRLKDRYQRAAVADSMTPVWRLVGAIAAAAFSGGVTGFLAGWAIAEVVTAGAYWWLAWCSHPPKPVRIGLARFPKQEPGVWLFALSTNFSASISTLGRQGVLLIVGAFGGAAVAGTYRVASQIGNALLRLAQSILRSVYPELVRQPENAMTLAGSVLRKSSLIAMLALGVAAIAGEQLIDVIAGPKFADAYLPMLVLAGAAGCEMAGASLEALLVARGLAGRNFVLRALPTLASVFALPFAIAHAGAVGAALTVLVASVGTLIGLLLHGRAFRLAELRSACSRL